MKKTLAFLLTIAIAGCGGGGGGNGDGGTTTTGGTSGGNWLAGNHGALLSSEDGYNYRVHPAKTPDDLLSIYCVQRTHGWAVGAGGFMMRTTDSGESWAVSETGTTETLRA